MSKFNDIANKLPKTYTFGRDKWFNVTDILNFVSSLQEAHEEEINEIQAAHKHTLDRIHYDSLERSKTLVMLAERSRSVLDSLANFVDPNREIHDLLNKHSREEAESVKRLVANGSLDGIFNPEELKDIWGACNRATAEGDNG